MPVTWDSGSNIPATNMLHGFRENHVKNEIQTLKVWKENAGRDTTQIRHARETYYKKW